MMGAQIDPCVVLWQAMNEAEKVGNRTDDKLIVEFLRRAGYMLAAAPATKALQALTEEGERLGLYDLPAEATGQADRITRIGAYLVEFAKKIGWEDGGDEGAFEFVQRASYEQGWKDAKADATGQAEPDDWQHLKPYGYAPGNYMSRCLDCGQTPIMDKRASRCRPCAEAAHSKDAKAEATGQAEPLFLLHCGQIDSGGEQDEWDCEADSGQRVEDFCRLHPGRTVKLHPHPPKAAQPMTLDEVIALAAVEFHSKHWQAVERVVRAVEKRCGIGGEGKA